ncbi:MAG: hypothetical protein KAR00_03170 [Candidatus Pacebacteria bacterium]|nr:hypothetical protein [Candidatus Paceibacterota bacterium]
MDSLNANLIFLSLIAFADLFIAFTLYQHSKGKLANRLFAGVAGASGLWVAVGVVRYYIYNFFGSAIYPYLFTKFSVVFAISIFFFFLLFSYTFPTGKLKINQKFLKFLVIFYLGIVILTFIPNAMLISEEFVSNAIQPIFIWGWVYTYIHTPTLILLFLFGLIRLIKTYKHTTKNSTENKQLHFTLMGCGLGGVFGIIFGLLVASFPELVDLFWIGRLSTISFVGFVAYAILKYEWLNVKIIATELFVFGLWSLTLFRVFLSKTTEDILINAGFFSLMIVIGVFLVKSAGKLEDLNTHLEERVEQQAGEIKKAYNVEKGARIKLEELNKEKDRFLLATQHELRTPLTVIKGYVDVALAREKDPESRRDLEQATEAGEKMTKVLNNVLKVMERRIGEMRK